MAGAAVQRCRVTPQKGAGQGAKGSAEMVAAAIRTSFAQPDAAHVHEQLDVIAGMLGRQFLKLEALLRLAGAVLVEATTSGKSATVATCPRAPWPC
jgi:putative transposase